MRAHAAADDGSGHPEDRPADARPAEDRRDLPGPRPVDADPAEDSGDVPEDRPADMASSPQAVNPLQRLIAGRLQERGWSYGEVARRSGLPRSTVYTLATTRNLVRPPRPATINGLARGLDVPVSAVRAAAAESTGMHYYDEPPADPRRGDPGDQERELLIASIDELSAEDRRHVAALVESLRNRPGPPAPLQLLNGPNHARAFQVRAISTGEDEHSDSTDRSRTRTRTREGYREREGSRCSRRGRARLGSSGGRGRCLAETERLS
jgi:transcriptional regulator with XRE-family HTH domain